MLNRLEQAFSKMSCPMVVGRSDCECVLFIYFSSFVVKNLLYKNLL